MEACVRGFSFMPETKVEVGELQYVEGGELSRAWKNQQRERRKDLESKIWDEFVKEQDVVGSICSDDPYQFLEDLPDDCLKELIENQINSNENEKTGVVNRDEKMQVQAQVTFEMREPRDTMVSFADDDDNECDVINIFDDDKDEDVSGADGDAINDSVESPCTVRENQNPESPGNESTESQSKDKSPENVSSMIETSIYRAKVKELQSKVNLELLSVITTLEAQDLNKIEPQDLPKLRRQCSEYCARYNRIYLYKLKRQIHVMTRHNNAALPFARHTFLRSQMNRAVSFQQNLLQALLVFHKWFTQKAPLRECVDSLKNFALLVEEGDRACPAEVHNEELLQTCQALGGVLDLYLRRVNYHLKYDKDISPRPRKSIAKHQGKKSLIRHKTAPQSNDLDARLSMYSLDKVKAGSKHSSVKDGHSRNTSKVRLNDASGRTNKTENSAGDSLRKKTSRSRRPLMRAPGTRQAKREKLRESDNIPTMVQSVKVCMSSNLTPELTPRHMPRDSPYPSPREMLLISKGSHKSFSPGGVQQKTPRSPPISPPKRPMCPPVLTMGSQEDLKLDLLPAVKVPSETLLSPVIKVQCEKKGSSRRSPTFGGSWSPKTYSPDTGSGKGSPRPMSPQSREKDKKGERKFSEIKDGESTFEVSKLLRRLCGGSSPTFKNERMMGTRNTQLLNFNGSSPRQPSTPQLLRILEETIQKKVPKQLLSPKPKVKDVDKYRMTFNLPAKTADTLLQYRTKFVQHMLSSAMYANSAVGKPWEMIGSVSEQILDEVLLSIAKEMQLKDYVEELFISETN